jgi:hypothetical protein
MDIVYMKKRFLIPLFLVLSLFIYSEENKSEIKIKPILNFSGTQGFSLVTDSSKLNFLNLEHDLFIGLEVPINIYTFGVWLEDSFIIDFADIQTFQKMLNNSLSMGIDNTFFIKNIMYANLNFNINFTLPYNQYKIDDYTPNDDKLYLILNPLVKLGGMYFFGLDWEIEQDFPIKLIFNTDASAFKPTTNFALSYEFFRFYGPKNFKFSFTTNESLTFSIPFINFSKRVIKNGDESENEDEGEDEGHSSTNDDSNNSTIIKPVNTFLNNLNIGLVFNFYGFSPSINFLYNLVYNMEGGVISIYELGFATGLSYTYKMLTFSIGYTGYMKNAETYNKWISTISTGISINLSTKKL